MTAIRRRDYRAAKNEYRAAKEKYNRYIADYCGGKHNEASPVARHLYLRMERALAALRALDY